MNDWTLKPAIALALLALWPVELGAAAADSRASATASYAPIGGPASVPYGWADFCSRQFQECTQPALPAVDIRFTSETWKVLNRINRQVNASIQPVSNLAHWGTIVDHWDYPTDGKGDCKVYALEKRKLLIAESFPRQALLMTIVKDLNGHGHAILTVKTNRGDFVLDNMNDEVKLWDRTGYCFVKRQSQEDPNVWVFIGDPTAAPDYVSQ
ncbi:MAG TPA: transglutaminase-like cysteine peptidase [Methylocella sp.]|nr:transglutaminase-like cysteine peptidase [Methylocella sp.]